MACMAAFAFWGSSMQSTQGEGEDERHSLSINPRLPLHSTKHLFGRPYTDLWSNEIDKVMKICPAPGQGASWATFRCWWRPLWRVSKAGCEKWWRPSNAPSAPRADVWAHTDKDGWQVVRSWKQKERLLASKTQRAALGLQVAFSQCW